MKKWLVMLAVVSMGMVQVKADTIQKESISSSAKWVVHMDIQKFAGSQIGGLVANEMTNAAAMAKLDFVRRVFGLDPLKDLTSATMYGKQYGNRTGVVIVRGKLDTAALETFVKVNDSYEAIPFGNRTIHKWLDKEHNNRPAHLCFTQPGVAVVSGNLQDVQDAIDVLDGKKDSLKKAGSLRGLDAADGVFMLASMEKAGEGLGDAQASLFKNSDWLTVSLGESAGKINFEGKLAANSAENAAQMEQVLRGMIAFMALSQEQNPGLADMAKAISVATENSVITVKFSDTAAAVFTFLKAQKGRSPDGMMPAPQKGADGATPAK